MRARSLNRFAVFCFGEFFKSAARFFEAACPQENAEP
jgi:hypothetical protein